MAQGSLRWCAAGFAAGVALTLSLTLLKKDVGSVQHKLDQLVTVTNGLEHFTILNPLPEETSIVDRLLDEVVLPNMDLEKHEVVPVFGFARYNKKGRLLGVDFVNEGEVLTSLLIRQPTKKHRHQITATRIRGAKLTPQRKPSPMWLAQKRD